MKLDIVNALNVLSELRALWDASSVSLDAQIADLQATIAPRLAELQAQRTALLADREKQIQSLEAEIKAAVLPLRASVKGESLTAVWLKPRVSWDGKALDGYAAAHPEILPFRVVGEPSVQIRAVKGGAE
jgi:hypothetical protein